MFRHMRTWRKARKDISVCMLSKAPSEFINSSSYDQYGFSKSANLSLNVLCPVTGHLLQRVKINSYLVRIRVIL